MSEFELSEAIVKKLKNDEFWMALALEQAEKAYDLGEVPVGAVLLKDNEIITQYGNLRETKPSATAHAEILCIEKACELMGLWRLSDCILYVTLEPCLMCCGAIINARIKRVVFGALDPKAGAACSLYQVFSDSRFNHRPEVIGGIRATEASRLLSNFFLDLRRRK